MAFGRPSTNHLDVLHTKVGKIFIDSLNSTINLGRRKKYSYNYTCECGITGVVDRNVLLDAIRKRGYYNCTSCRPKERSVISIRTKTKYHTQLESFSRRVYSIYNSQAKKRSYSFDLSFEDFQKYLLDDCHYCGMKAEDSRKEVTNNTPSKQIVRKYFNGVDRKNNNLGYNVGNCVSCCTDCNRAKNNLSYEQFLELINKIYKRRIVKDGDI